jgi:hypothetical protein
VNFDSSKGLDQEWPIERIWDVNRGDPRCGGKVTVKACLRGLSPRAGLGNEGKKGQPGLRVPRGRRAFRSSRSWAGAG